MKSDINARVSIDINAPIDRVWDALTNPTIIKQYFFGTNTITDWKPGNPIKFTGEWDGKIYEDKGTILAYERNKLVSYSYWSSMSGIEDKPENYVIVTYKVDGSNGKTNLTITQENIPDEQRKEHSIENWKMVMDGLKKLVEEKPI